MPASQTPRAAALRTQIDMILQDISVMSAEELETLGLSLEIIPAVEPETTQVISTNPLRLRNGRIAKAPHAE